ncbi:MAG: DUF2490 domain-containing protein [Owenweeksia sp.]|nr:DUF2490 domain-containing protein [Owenweeksia sp.]
MFLLATFWALLGGTPADGQSFKTTNQELIWLAAKVKWSLQNDWTLSLKYAERRYLSPDRAQQRVVPDLAITKEIGSRTEIGGGLWVFSIFSPQDAAIPIETSIYEWRPYLKFSHKTGASKNKFLLGLQAEARYFNAPTARNHFDGPIASYAYRGRGKIGYEILLSESLKLQLSEELFMNMASNQAISNFDQNRLRADLFIELLPAWQLKIGYLHWFQPTGEEATYFSRHILTTQLTYTIGGSR